MDLTDRKVWLSLIFSLLAIALVVFWYHGPVRIAVTENKSIASSAPLRPALSSLNDIKSVTFSLPNQSTSQALDQLAKTLPKIKAAGFNTIWFVSWWPTFEPQPLVDPPIYNAQSFAQLRQTLELLRQNNMRAIIGLNYIGDQRNPGAPRVPEFNIDRCQWLKNPLMYQAFENYVTRFLTEIADYNDISYIDFFTEGTWNGYYCSQNYIGRELALKLQSSLGSLPTRLPPELRNKFLIGLHDGFLINFGETDISPAVAPMPFDFVSMTVYEVDAFTNQQIRDRIDQSAARFRAFYPDIPLMIGELGATACTLCASGQEENEARVNGEIVSYALQKNYGFNVWDWAGLTHSDGSPKKSLGVIRNAIQGITAPSPGILKRDDQLRIRGVVKDGFQWTHTLQSTYNGVQYDGRDQTLYDLRTDPFELNNLMKRQSSDDNPLTRLLQDPTYGKSVRKLRKALAVWQTDSKDPFRRQITSPISISYPQPGNVRLDWQTDWYTTSEIEYHKISCASCLLAEVNDFNFVTSHRAVISGLKPGTKYNIRVYSIGDNGNGAYTDSKFSIPR